MFLVSPSDHFNCFLHLDHLSQCCHVLAVIAQSSFVTAFLNAEAVPVAAGRPEASPPSVVAERTGLEE